MWTSWIARGIRVVSAGVVIAIAGSVWFSAAAAPLDSAASDSVLSQLRERRFAELDASLNSQQRLYEADPAREEALQAAFRPFHATADDLDPVLTEWMAKHPDSYAAHLARGIYRSHRGWDARGDKYIDETPDENIRGMEEWFDKALPDLERSLRLTPKPLLSYIELIEIAKARGWKDRKRHWINEANRVAPSNIEARHAYLISLRPRWGGSLIEMIAFVEESSKHVAPAHQRRLESYVWRARGREARQRGDLRAAAQHYTRSLELYDRDGEMYIYRGWMFADLGQWTEALRDYDRAVELRPNDVWAYRRRGALLLKMNELERALADFEHAAKLKPNDGWVLGNRGYVHERRGRLAQAFADYQKAALVGDAWAQNRLGEFYWHGHGTARNPQEAIRWWKSAAEKGNRQAQEHLKNEAAQP